MSNSTKNLIENLSGPGGRRVNLPVDGGSHIYAGTLVAQLIATGMLVPASTAGSGPAIGMAMHEQDNTSGSDGDKRCWVQTDKVFRLANGLTTDACSETTLMHTVVYALDDHTIADNSNGGTLQPAGIFMGMEEDGLVRIYVGHAAAMELYQTLLTVPGSILFSLNDFREVDANSDVGAIAANGGILASDTTPILRGNAAETQEISWATGNVDGIATQIELPDDFDGSAPCTLEVWVNSGTTDAASFVVETGWDGGALVADAVDDSATKSATTHKATATIAAADIPDTASFLTLVLTPPTHATNAIQLLAARLRYQRKPITS
jgi:hypothetical protein